MKAWIELTDADQMSVVRKFNGLPKTVGDSSRHQHAFESKFQKVNHLFMTFTVLTFAVTLWKQHTLISSKCFFVDTFTVWEQHEPWKNGPRCMSNYGFIFRKNELKNLCVQYMRNAIHISGFRKFYIILILLSPEVENHAISQAQAPLVQS